MGETSHARSRRAALFGLILQLVVAAAVFPLAMFINSSAMWVLAWYTLAGAPIWFVVALVYRQHELAALEEMDLDELRREKQTGGGEAMFGGEGSGGLGFMVARQRLEWMQRWLLPTFGLLICAILAGLGAWLLRMVFSYDPITKPWPALRSVEIGMVITALLMLFLFFYARYAAGLGRVPEWQLLRACGSYMLGTAVIAMAIFVCLGAHLYRGAAGWENIIAIAIPIMMLVLAAETLANFVLDIYRPRTPGSEPRACFDSRLIGLIAEPGGIANSVAEAMNYQFGFKVSHTWFYQLLQAALIPLVGIGMLVVWLMSTIVIVQPYEHLIIERFGTQLSVDAPLGPGTHFKRPWPFDVARKYNTDQLFEFIVGYKNVDDFEPEDEHEDGKPEVEQWTDAKHHGHDHFDFIIAPASVEGQSGESAFVHLARMNVLVQYTLDAARLAQFTQNASDPHAIIRDIGWEEIVRFGAASTLDALLSELREQGGQLLRERIQHRTDELQLGLKLVHVGILGVHPEKSVAEAFRKVIEAQQERIADIRKAHLTENSILSEVAGDTHRALRLAHAIEQVQNAEGRDATIERALREAAVPKLDPARIAPMAAAINSRLDARWSLDQAIQLRDRVTEDFERGSGSTVRELRAADERVQLAEKALAAADQTVETGIAPLRTELRSEYDDATAELLLESAKLRYTLRFWSGLLESNLEGLEGTAAVTLAAAQTRRWERELQAEADVARTQNERHAYAASPRIYKARRYLEVLVKGLAGARKYFLAFDPKGRNVKVRFETQEMDGPDFTQMSLESEGQ